MSASLFSGCGGNLHAFPGLKQAAPHPAEAVCASPIEKPRLVIGLPKVGNRQKIEFGLLHSTWPICRETAFQTCRAQKK
jgi:hypothetical protein